MINNNTILSITFESVDIVRGKTEKVINEKNAIKLNAIRDNIKKAIDHAVGQGKYQYQYIVSANSPDIPDTIVNELRAYGYTVDTEKHIISWEKEPEDVTTKFIDGE